VAAESEINGEESKDGKSPLHESSAVFSDSETEASKVHESGGDNDIDENSLSPIPMTKILPTLRLNVALASDPATNPDAKEIHSDNLKNLDQEYDSMGSSRNDDAETQISLSKITLSDEKQQQQQQQQNLVMPKSKENISNVGNLIAKNLELMRPNVFMCTPCGIRFSSLSTLEAHCTYYCSHRKIDENALKNSSNGETNGGEPPTKAIKTGKQYACTQCSYSADKKVSLNRHMRMHQTSPTPSSTTSNGGDEGSNPIVVAPQIITPVTLPIIDRYCTNCDIRFSSTKTYRAHKQHYCSSRHQS
jgi:zinc finger protein ZFPM1